MDLSPYFQKKLGEHLKIAKVVTDKESREDIYRLFDLEVIAVDDDGVTFQVWSFSFSHFYDEARYYDGKNHGVIFTDFSKCDSVEHLLGKTAGKYIGARGLEKESYSRGPFLAHL